MTKTTECDGNCFGHSSLGDLVIVSDFDIRISNFEFPHKRNLGFRESAGGLFTRQNPIILRQVH